MIETFILKQAEAIFEDGEPIIRYIGYLKDTDENFMFDIDFGFWNQLYSEFDGDEKLVDDVCIKYAMDARGHFGIEVERKIDHE